jgi:hypothetical protein
VLALVWVPPRSNPAAPPVTALSQYHSKYIQVSGNGEYEFDIPFSNTEYWKAASGYDMTLLKFDKSKDSVVYHDPDPIKGTNGKVYLYMISRPVGIQDASVSPSIDILMSVSWPEIAFARPSLAVASNLPHRKGATYQTNSRGDYKPPEKLEHHGSDPISSPAIMMGEHVDDVVALMKREMPYVRLKGPGPHVVSPLANHMYLGPSYYNWSPDAAAATSKAYNRSYYSYYSCFFLQQRGEFIFTVLGFDAEKSGESSGVIFSNVNIPVNSYLPSGDIYNSFPYLAYGDFKNKFSDHTTALASNMSEGFLYRPTNAPTIPATCSVPYYSTSPWWWINTGHRLEVNYGYAPSLSFDFQCDTDSYHNILLSVGDTFSFGGLWPPEPTIRATWPERQEVTLAEFP